MDTEHSRSPRFRRGAVAAPHYVCSSATWYALRMSGTGQRARGPALGAVLCWLAVAGWVPAAGAAVSKADEARASAAYEAALVAIHDRDYARAASLFAEADAIVPNVVALRSAIDAAVLAEDPVLAVRLSERAAHRPRDGALEACATKALAEFEHRVGRIKVECPASPCSAMVDGTSTAIGEPLVVAVGDHSVVIDDGARVTRREVEVEAGATAVATPWTAQELSAQAETPAGGGGWSPAWFWVGLGTTAVLGGFTIWSAVDTRDRHDEYLETGQGADEGRASQLRTDVMFFVTLGLGLATAAVGIFAVDWSDGDEATVTATLGPGSVAVAGRFP